MREGIRAAFEGDTEIFNYSDPSLKASSIEELCQQIEKKLKEHEAAYPCKFVNVKANGETVGYFFYRRNNKTLISFGINKKYRKNKDFFNIIAKELGSFISYVFTRNTRAIKWMEKNGMKIIYQDKLVTTLEK